ncbi:MAG: mechanosensitive ion channel family protein [Candidatus Omnitrophota bacterium]|nr:MAG: mechanosensitive ion channel family protein [Candidatus Omnitrophota bacterium]
MLIAEEKARLTEEELSIAKEKAAIAEGKLREKRKELYTKLIQTGLVIIIGYLLIFAVVGIINRRIKELKAKHVVRKNAVYLVNFFIILAIIFVWLQNINSMTIIFSVMGAGLALALQEMILCIAGWFTILLRRPFEVGDRIEFGGVKGDVIDVRLVHTTLLEIGNWVEADQSTGRIVNVPNSAVFKKETYNYSRGFEFIWNEIKILVTFESDWKRAEEIMMKHAAKHSEGMENIVKRKIDKMSKRYMIYFEKFTPIVYADIKDSGVELSLRYLTEDKRRRTTQDMLCRAILRDFEKEGNVNFAYTTYRIVK